MKRAATRIFIVVLCASMMRAGAAVRVALLDFTADDNTWFSSGAAKDFTAVLQAQLSRTTNVEWVERSELKSAQRELEISELGLMAGSQAIQRGQWVKADWLLVGRFTLSDEGQRLVKLELLDLNHAELLADKTVALGPDKSINPSPANLTPVVMALQAAFAEGATWLRQATNQLAVAPLFFADVSVPAGGWRENLRPLEKRFQEFMTEWIAQHPSLRLREFPRAYQSLDEAVMASGGLTSAAPWQQLANLYVWGTCEITNARGTDGRLSEKTVRICVNAWNGSGEPLRLEERLAFSAAESISMPAAIATLDGLLRRALRNVDGSRGGPDSAGGRKQITAALLQEFDKLNSKPGRTLGLTHSEDERESFQALVRMLEAACFFDPENAGAHARRISTRWGWWMDFGGVSNEFWSKWRRSEEWGKYGERFGLAPVIALPFPFQKSGIAGAYEDSIHDLTRMMRIDNKEQAYGFPTGVPPEVQAQWREELETEARNRSQRAAAELQRQQPKATATAARNASRESSPAAPIIRPGPATVKSVVAPADWMNHLTPMFVVNRPMALPQEITAPMEVIPFPEQAGVSVVNQLLVARDRLWIVAESEQPEGVNVSQPDIALEMDAEGSRLWSCTLTNPKPQQVKTAGLPRYVASVAAQGDNLWAAGNGVARMQLPAQTVKAFGLRDGFTLADATSITISSQGEAFAVGDSCKILRLAAEGGQWDELPVKNSGPMYYGSSDPLRVCAQADELLLVAGALVLRETSPQGWTNFGKLSHTTYAVAADVSGFWIGEHRGLNRLDPQRRTLTTWRVDDYPQWQASQHLTTPAMLRLQARGGYDPATNRESSPEEAAGRLLRHELGKLAESRERAFERRQTERQKTDSLELSNRFPGPVRALAHDGEFLWLGFEQPALVLLYHKPSHACVAWVKMSDSVRSLAVSAEHLWIGFGYREIKLARLPKAEFQAVPRTRWLPNRVGADEFARILARLPLRQQSLHHFFAGDQVRTLELLTREDAADLEGMFLRAYCYDAFGTDEPELCGREFAKIMARFPNSPWAQAAQDAIARNQRVRQERGHPELKTQREHAEQQQRAKQFRARAMQLFKQCDMNGDQTLNPMETSRLWMTLSSYFHASPQIVMKRRGYDTNKDSQLDVGEFDALVEDLQKQAAETGEP